MRHLPWIAVLMCSSMPASAGIYKCLNAQGKTYFSDRPCTARASTGLKSGDAVEKLTTEEARIKGGSMSVLGNNEATRERLKRDNPALYNQLMEEAKRKGVRDTSGCEIRGDGVVMEAKCR